jgi:septum formation protein
MNTVPLLLASSSPRRKEILSSLSLSFRVVSSEVDETPFDGEPVFQTVRRLALAKANKISVLERTSLVIGADTLVSFQGYPLGKPETSSQAVAMLSLLNGKTHQVVTGVAFVKQDENILQTVECCTNVTFKKLPMDEIQEYVSSGEPFGKAGAYAIQETGSKLIQKYDGSFTNIVGLPVTELLRFFIQFGTDRLEWTN